MTEHPAGTVRSVLEGPKGSVEYLTTGSGTPATVFAHGLAGSIATTRPFGSGVAGSRTFVQFGGTGDCAPKAPWTYAVLADELTAVADHVGATQALGVSMGAGALCSLLAASPRRFERLVFVMPAVLDRPRTDGAMDLMVAMAQAVDDRDVQALTALLLQAEPASARIQPVVQLWCRRRAVAMVGTTISRALRALPAAIPVADGRVLAAVRAPALVIAQEGDPAHPVRVAQELAGLLPDARLEVLAPGGLLWRHREAMRELIGGFLCGRHASPAPG